MSAAPIVRVAAKGEGATADGRYVALSAPGDMLEADGTLTWGPNHVEPPCRHFPACGGCQLQHLSEAALTDFVGSRVIGAAKGQELDPGTPAPTHLSPPRTRRRATLHAQAIGRRVVLGFREGGSHKTIDMRECHVIAPELMALVAPLRTLLESWQDRKLAVDVELTLADQGVAVGFSGLVADNLARTEALLDFARDHRLARLTIDTGYGPETTWEPDPATITLGGTAVGIPPGAFLQATADGEAALVAAAQGWLAGASTVADLFAGLGTFAFALAGPGTKVLAVEAARDAHLACQAAARSQGRPVHALHRDLFRNPLRAEELNRFAAVLLDPPRAGAREQVGQIAESTVARVVYISCNPASWARDAATLVAAGYRLEGLKAVGQFRWSTHVELASLFVRAGA
ncbi:MULTISPECIES: class I SAM-dependent RNA methyltransferase [unclassified Novosphingobium]|uniref:class I SAM-dependent RNA methyltransferase n=1 Tax=unclassified Novosphingobium TaxID=2644732 RepID=UPI0014412C08|nr:MULTISPECIES: class I SAM-dependent RNA methyltransferase [unclassified Novosphingobium]MBB3357753.1 23S rRNA (uracil1939-C5)-methyltransferase [Novosphingobium sp. BK256]MBB3373583.1 23S rRNA (uracil1939-C5)-methyltransferase [Novosphingobium sp. BK280]MBB3377995.1 23S rRNA (uracil1939-C5)-methyltransferase [Novosphingobium sp. BK258]MBB3420220.1 23S rRNA (uracil1939-C5)-methyltransferase [Novosphingobium sp. BK267]MBB3447458.1 23S rRNA (uracil1939-C5)-methyltransferase [Novosphingobium sp